MRQTITTANAPSSPFYSQGVRVGDTVHISGLVGVDPATGEMAGPGIGEQTRQAILNCRSVLESAGGTLEDVAEVGVLLTRPEYFADMNEAYAELFDGDLPVRYVAKLGVDLPGVLVSIRMTAYLSSS